VAIFAGFGFFTVSPSHRDVVLVQKWKRISHHGFALAARSFYGDWPAVIGIFLIRRGSLSALAAGWFVVLGAWFSDHIRSRLVRRRRP
jgi:hypothetical protein